MPPRIAIIGAGPSGLAALKVLRQAGLTDTVAFEQGERVGGNWVYTASEGHSSVFDTTHIISSKRLSAYSDFPMPDHYPDYPSHRELLAYFESYARHFDLYPAIRFRTRVTKAHPEPSGGWRLTLGDGTTELFDHLLVASGHHWDPRMPEYPGEFTGTLLHSHAFKSSEPFRAQRVLVVGGGNSACDIAVETSRVSAHTGLSTRRGYYIVPKFMFGLPTDVLNARMLWLPRAIRSWVHRLGWRLETGGMARYGLPEPEHGILDAHPTVNSELLYFLRHGTIHPYPDIARFEGKTIHFSDGRAEPFDAVIAATGFRITFPFLDRSLMDFSEGAVELYLRVFHPAHSALYFIGLVQPQGCIWPLAEAQAHVVAATIQGRVRLPPDVAVRAREDAAAIQHRYTESHRHTVEVEYHEYLRELQRTVG
ncbi:MAG: flavin-containing monooxygenase [Gemmatimonadales bacterium]